VGNAETLKALADPVRLALLNALMRGGAGHLRVMSVKELAAELGEPQTKLYRHIKQLEAAELVRVAETRMVSGILEQRYQACQADLQFGRRLLHDRETADDAVVVFGTLWEAYFDRFFAAYAEDQLAATEHPPAHSYRKPLLSFTEVNVPQPRAAEFRDRIQKLVDEMSEAGETADAEGVEIHAMIAFYSTASSQDS
jgi:DNA-binding transcriptional ArsR family regulator